MLVEEAQGKLYEKLYRYKVSSLIEVKDTDPEISDLIEEVDKQILLQNSVKNIEDLVCPMCRKALSEETVCRDEELLCYRKDAYGSPWCIDCFEYHDNIDWDLNNY